MLQRHTPLTARCLLPVLILVAGVIWNLPCCGQSVTKFDREQNTDTNRSVRLDSPIPIYVAKGESRPLQRAVKDLQRDLQNVLGKKCPITHDKQQLRRGTAIVVIGPDADVSLGKAGWAKGREAHRVFVAEAANSPYIVLQGADTRGAIYAVYTFSEKFLGIPPLWLWASHEVERRKHIDVPLSTDLLFDSPSVRWRAFFPNDQDYQKTWDVSPSKLDAVAETVLRLKLNAWDTDTIVDDSMKGISDAARVAQERGIVAMSTHTSPLGTGMQQERWNNYWQNIRGVTPPEMRSSDLANLSAFWKHCIELIVSKDIETIWTVTFRAPGDHAFWEAYEDAPTTDLERAALVQTILKRQVELVNKFGGDRSTIRIPLYNELSDFFLAGLLELPARKNVIWNLVSARRDHFPPHGVREFRFPDDQPLGLYFNMNFVSTGSHVVAGEGPWKMEANFRTIESLNRAPLEFSIVNTGNFREFVMELSANARMMWDFDGYDSDSFLQDFATQYFGSEHAAPIAELYRKYYDSYWQQRNPSIEGFERQYIFQDLRYARAMREIRQCLKSGKPINEQIFTAQDGFFRIIPEDTGATNVLDAILLGTAQSIEKLERVTAEADMLMQQLPKDRRTFFNDNLRVPSHFMLRLNQSLHALALASRASDQPGEKNEHLRTALTSFRQARKVLRETEHGIFEDWYPKPGERDHFGFNGMESGISQLLD